MHIYLVRRRNVASGANELDAALLRLRSFEDAPQLGARRLRWRMSYVLREAEGGLGLACVCAATDAQALREHALAVGLPLDEALRVTSTQAAASFDSTHLYLVRRRYGRIDGTALDRALAATRHVADDQRAPRIRWLCTYALCEADGSSGSACLYRAADPAALIDHANRARLPTGEVTPVLGRVVFRIEPQGRTLPLAPCHRPLTVPNRRWRSSP